MELESSTCYTPFTCAHRFHESCAKSWLDEKNGIYARCPICRNPCQILGDFPEALLTQLPQDWRIKVVTQYDMHGMPVPDGTTMEADIIGEHGPSRPLTREEFEVFLQMAEATLQRLQWVHQCSRTMLDMRLRDPDLEWYCRLWESDTAAGLPPTVLSLRRRRSPRSRSVRCRSSSRP